MKDTTKADRSITQVCLDSCDKALSQIQRVKQAVLTQFRDLKSEHGHALRLALNEAEALAWQTAYPQLVFADLAEEKARALAAWSERQRAVRG